MTAPRAGVRHQQITLRIMQELAVSGGMTSTELAARLGVDARLVRPRLSALKKAGRLYFTGERRQDDKGRRLRVVALRRQPEA